jgi:hypothetical protein
LLIPFSVLSTCCYQHYNYEIFINVGILWNPSSGGQTLRHAYIQSSKQLIILLLLTNQHKQQLMGNYKTSPRRIRILVERPEHWLLRVRRRRNFVIFVNDFLTVSWCFLTSNTERNQHARESLSEVRRSDSVFFV